MLDPLYKETYRGVGFHETHKGYWVFDESIVEGWTRYFDTDIEDFIGGDCERGRVIAMIHRAIDRKLEKWNA